MKERVTLTIDKELLHNVDAQVDGNKIKNRSHAMELLLRKALIGGVPDKAVILAGGKGTRLSPLTDTTPKSLIDLNGQPIMQYNVDLCRRHGVQHIILSVGHMREQIIEHYKKEKDTSYIEEEHPLGTGGPLKLLKEQLTNTFLLMNSDELKDINLKAMYQFHLEHGAKATLALTTVEDPSSYGVVIMDGHKIEGFIEKPKKEDAPSNLISAGLYIIEPDVIDLLPEGFSMVERDLFPKLAQQGVLFGYPFPGQWFGTDTKERLEAAKNGWQGFTH
ncbi:MAG: sugar phosphate nucleotidyltransferase [Candidatus Woesearchaeota archaeon]|nr:sugar phosphate nucleotidyltransferase [Candidatus Woesearchaeota archaeon]